VTSLRSCERRQRTVTRPCYLRYVVEGLDNEKENTHTYVGKLAIFEYEEIVLLAELREGVDEGMIEVLDDVDVSLVAQKKYVSVRVVAQPEGRGSALTMQTKGPTTSTIAMKSAFAVTSTLTQRFDCLR
jgi:hypothetical protein